MVTSSHCSPKGINLLIIPYSYDPSTKIGIKFKTRWYVIKASHHHHSIVQTRR